MSVQFVYNYLFLFYYYNLQSFICKHYNFKNKKLAEKVFEGGLLSPV